MNRCNYVFNLIKNKLSQGVFWLSCALYAFLLVLPLYSEYFVGASVPVYHFLIQTYMTATTGAILVLLASFPFSQSMIQDKETNFMNFVLLRMSYRQYIACHVLANTICCVLLVCIAYIVSVFFISLYAPLDIADMSYHLQYVNSYLNAKYLAMDQVGVFYMTQLLLQICQSLFYLWWTLVLSFVFSDLLVVGTLPLLLYSVFKSLFSFVKLPLFLNPNVVFSPIHHLKTLLPNMIKDDLHQIVYIMGYSIVIGVICYCLMVRLIKKYATKKSLVKV